MENEKDYATPTSVAVKIKFRFDREDWNELIEHLDPTDIVSILEMQGRTGLQFKLEELQEEKKNSLDTKEDE